MKTHKIYQCTQCGQFYGNPECRSWNCRNVEAKDFVVTTLHWLQMTLNQFRQFVNKQPLTDEEKNRIHQFAEDAYSRGNTASIARTGSGHFSVSFLPKHIADYYKG